jgi:hypothetical protein
MAARATAALGTLLVVAVALAPGADAASPQLGLRETASVSGQSVTFTYEVSNAGSTGINDMTVTGTWCPQGVYVGGDGAPLDVLGPGETWTYRCVVAAAAPGTRTDDATARATEVGSGAVVSASARATVTVGDAAAPAQAMTGATTVAPTTTTTLASGHVYMPDQVPTMVQGASGTRPDPTPPTLPFTGRDLGLPALAGAGLVLVGVAVLASARERRPQG